MHRSEILKSSAFRLALAFSVLFFITFIAAGLIAYQIIMSDLHERLDRTLSETFDMISRSYSDGDLEDLIGTVQTYAASTQGHDRIFYLADGAGPVLACRLALLCAAPAQYSRPVQLQPPSTAAQGPSKPLGPARRPASTAPWPNPAAAGPPACS